MARLVVHRGASTGELVASPAFSILNNLLAAGEVIPHDCGGKAQCGTCRVRVLSGAAGITRPGEAELARLAAVHAGPDERLACQCRAARDAEIIIIGRIKADREDGEGGSR